MLHKRIFKYTHSINSLCSIFEIENYCINSDGSIDVNGDVDLRHRHLERIPLKFATVTGYFSCSDNKITSLEGAPSTVGSHFDCSSNDLTSLVGGPKSVGGSFVCYDNQLSTLEGAPHTIGGDLCSQDNKLNNTYSGDIDIELIGDYLPEYQLLPRPLHNNLNHIQLILKYQRHFEIWNDDLSLNIENFIILMLEIEDGLL